MKKYFSPLRFIRTLNVEFIDQWRAFFFLGIISGVMFSFVAIIMLLFGKAFEEGQINFFFALSFLFGWIGTAGVFTDIRNQQRGFSFYMLPASTLEKYLSKFLISLFGYFVFSIVSMAIFSSLMSLLCMAKLDSSFLTINPLTVDMANMLWWYVIGHSIYFFGSVMFRKLPYILTSLILFATGIFLMITFLIILIIMGTNHQETMEKIAMYMMQNKNSLSSWKDYAWYSFKALLPVILYVLTFLKLKRRQLVE